MSTQTHFDQWAFEKFANTYPHEAADMDWERFVALCKQRNPEVTEQDIRRVLEET